MQQIDLKYGDAEHSFAYDDAAFTVLSGDDDAAPLSDAEIGARLDDPVGSPLIEDIVTSGGSVLIVVPDATRRIGCGQIVNLLVRRLIANGTNAFDIRIIFATGLHRKVTDDERAALLTPFIAQRIKTLDHGPRDLMQIARLGETSGGIPVELNRALVTHDHVIIIGGISYHYFAGFTGGRKLICPGLASSRTIAATHKLAFDVNTKERRQGVDTGCLDGNAVHESFVEAAQKVDIDFAVNTIVNSSGEITDVICGEWITSHRRACERFDARRSVEIAERRDLVIASCGGSPYDIDLIQAHKALDTATRACVDGGQIVLLAKCPGGTGRAGFLDRFDAANSVELAERLCSDYQVSGQTAWSLLKKTERFEVSILTDLDVETTAKIRMKKLASVADLSSIIAKARNGYILPAGAGINIRVS